MYISVDFGATNCRIAASHDVDRPVLVGEPLRLVNGQNYEQDLAALITGIRQVADFEPIQAVGMGFAGRINDQKTQVASAHNHSHWSNQPLTEAVSTALNCPAYLENDAVVSAIGAAYYNETPSDFYFLIWGTGIGGSHVTHDGEHVSAIDLLWPVYFEAWENDCGGRSLSKQLGISTYDMSDKQWIEVQDQYIQHLQQFVTKTRTKFVVLSGGLAVKNFPNLDLMKIQQGCKVQLSSFGEDSGLYGGFGLIRQNSL